MASTYFFWDPLSDNILQERDEAGAVTAEYTAEPGLHGNVISQNLGGVESQLHCDAQGSVLAVTDDNQQVTDTLAYSAFGEVTERIGTTVLPFQYLGQKGYYRDPLTGEYLARRRPYDSGDSRWLAADPLGILDDPNFYCYVKNNPVIGFDPSGLLCVLQENVDCNGAMESVLERLKGLVAEMKKGDPPCELPPIVCCPAAKPKKIDFSNRCIICYPSKESDPVFRGFYDIREKKIYLCPSNANDQVGLETTLIEEIQHYFDDCKFRGEFGFENECLDKACRELRGKTLSGECDDKSRRKPNESREQCLVRRVSASLLGKCESTAEESARKVLKDPRCKQLKPIPKPE